MFFDADTSFVRFFWWYSFGLHIPRFVLAPNSAGVGTRAAGSVVHVLREVGG